MIKMRVSSSSSSSRSNSSSSWDGFGMVWGVFGECFWHVLGPILKILKIESSEMKI